MNILIVNKAIKFLALLVFLFISLVITGCAKLTYDPQKNYGFDSNKISGLPPLENGKSRIMVYRPSAFGWAIKYNMSIDYNPTFDESGKNINKADPKVFLGKTRAKNSFFRDLEPSLKPVAIHSATERQYNLQLVLEPNKAYCLEAGFGGLTSGTWVQAPYYVPVEYERCAENFPKYYNKDEQEQWKKDEEDFIKKQEKIEIKNKNP